MGTNRGRFVSTGQRASGRFAPLRFKFPAPLGRFAVAIASARQRQAGARLVAYLRGLPDDVIRKLGVPPADMEKLRRCGEAHPPASMGA